MFIVLQTTRQSVFAKEKGDSKRTNGDQKEDKWANECESEPRWAIEIERARILFGLGGIGTIA